LKVSPVLFPRRIVVARLIVNADHGVDGSATGSGSLRVPMKS
jgi:hypothetical protein